MSNIQDDTIKALKGNKTKYNELLNYYRPSFIKMIVKYHGEGYVNDAKKEYLEIFKQYFIKERKTSLYSYLYYKYIKLYNHDRGLTYMIDYDNNFIIEHYNNKLYDTLKNNKSVNIDIISDKKLKILCYEIIKRSVDNYAKSDRKSSIGNYFSSKINQIQKLFSKEEKILLYYSQIFGADKQTEEFFLEKYKHLMNQNNLNFDDYRLIIQDILLKDNLVFLNFEAQIKNAAIKKRKNSNEKIKQIFLKLKNQKEITYKEYLFLRKYYSYIKEDTFNFCKLNINIETSNDHLIDIINEKYEQILLNYINGVKNDSITSRPSKYIHTTMYNYFSNKTSLKNIRYVDDSKENNIKTLTK